MKGIVWKNATSSTELPRDFCAGIGPLQLGVVLVVLLDRSLMIAGLEISGCTVHPEIWLCT